MARIVGSIGCTHVPAIGGAVARGLQGDAYWKPFFDGFPPARAWLDDVKPDVAVMFYNDHGLNFFLNNLPTFAVGAAPEYSSEDEGWGIPTVGSFKGEQGLSWHIIEQLVADEFDPATCQEMVVDHACTLPLKLLWPGGEGSVPVRIVPIAINTVQFPIPSPLRCYKLGLSVGRAIESYAENLKVLVMGTGGLSHQLEGPRAGFINREFDLECFEKLVSDPEYLTRYSALELVRLAGTQGVEVMAWLAARATMSGHVTQVHRSYHIPISNTAAGLQVLAHQSSAAVQPRRGSAAA